MILDTSFLIDYCRGKLPKGSIDNFSEVYVTSISCMELYFGALRYGNKAEQEEIMSLLNSLNVLEFDFQSALEASKIRCGLEKNGFMIDVQDIMIAAIARTSRQKIITKNIKHFEKIEGLEISSY